MRAVRLCNFRQAPFNCCQPGLLAALSVLLRLPPWWACDTGSQYRACALVRSSLRRDLAWSRVRSACNRQTRLQRRGNQPQCTAAKGLSMPLSAIHSGVRPYICAAAGHTTAASSSNGTNSSSSSSSSSHAGAPLLIDRSTLVLSYAPTPAAAAGATSLVQNYASSFVAWSDVFDVHATPCDAWWLRNACAHDASELCVPDVEQLRSMGSRLARAAQLAASGSKWGLLKAVLLSWDTVPASPQNWVRQQIALEACGLLILPAAAQGLDADVKGAWEQLPGKEQQLWCQLQQARLEHHCPEMQPAVVTHYTIDPVDIAVVLQRTTGVAEAGALLAEPALNMGMLVAALCCRGIFPSAAVRRRNMDASYTALLVCCAWHGHDHPITREALADTRVTDPHGWVPLLLAGLAYPSLTKGPGVVQGSKEEATAYAFSYGMYWWEEQVEASNLDPAVNPLQASAVVCGCHLTWLLQQRGIEVPTTQEQADLHALRALSCGVLHLAYNSASAVTSDVGFDLSKRDKLEVLMAITTMGMDNLARACLVVLGCLFQLTYNLPPLDVAPQLWGRVAELLGIPWEEFDLDALRHVVVTTAREHHRIASYNLPLEIPFPETCQCPSEVFDMHDFLLSCRPSMWRLQWQLGFARGALLPEKLDQEQALLQRSRSWGTDPRPVHAQQQGILPVGSAGWKAVKGFLENHRRAAKVQPAAAAAATAGGGGAATSKDQKQTTSAANSSNSSSSGSSGGSRSSASSNSSSNELPRASFTRDPLFASFPGWVDQLVSQVVGRPVTLAISTTTAPAICIMPGVVAHRPQAEVFLVESDGRKVPFSWQEQRSGSTGTTTANSSSSSSSSPMPGNQEMHTMEAYRDILVPAVAASSKQLQASGAGVCTADAGSGAGRGTPAATTPPSTSSGSGSSSERSAARAGGTGRKAGFSFKAALAGSSQPASSSACQPAGSSSSGGSGAGAGGGGSSDSQPVVWCPDMLDLRGVKKEDLGRRVEEYVAQSARPEGIVHGKLMLDPGMLEALRDRLPVCEEVRKGLVSLGIIDPDPNQGMAAAPAVQSSSRGAAAATSAAAKCPTPTAGSTAGGAGHAGSHAAAGQQAGEAGVAAPCPGAVAGGAGISAATATLEASPARGADTSAVSSAGSKKKPRPCAMCGQLFTKLQRCSQCKKVLYCSKEHQVAHWKLVHKLECKGAA